MPLREYAQPQSGERNTPNKRARCHAPLRATTLCNPQKPTHTHTHTSKMLCGIIAIFAVVAVFASVDAFAGCAAGSFASGNECKSCKDYFAANRPAGCPANSNCTVQGAHTVNPNTNVWNVTGAPDASWCMCNFYFETPNDSARARYFNQSWCQNGPSGKEWTNYEFCNVGYYAVTPRGSIDSPLPAYGDGCAPCTGLPDNARFTDRGRDYRPAGAHPGSKANQCPWDCKANFDKIGENCICSGDDWHSGVKGGVCIQCGDKLFNPASGECVDDFLELDHKVLYHGANPDDQCWTKTGEEYVCCIRGKTWNDANQSCSR